MSKNKKHKVGGLGEVLWDIFSDTKKLGGAPANFAAHAQQLGAKSYLLSAVGKDLLGQKVITRLQHLQVDTSGIQVKTGHTTGHVNVSLNPMGSPIYDIQENMAWDHIKFDDINKKTVKDLDALCFGTLAQRNPKAQACILKILKSTTLDCLRVFDVNFRQDFYSPKMVQKSLDLANAVKMNEDEFSIIVGMFSLLKNHEKGLQSLIRKFNLKFGIITLGENGAVMANQDEFCFYSPKNTIEIKSTVGAGDAFTAAAVMGWLDQKSLKKIIKEASDLGTYVCSHLEAVPKI
ncbi:MAG: carbohydrate kinase [Flavobacteriaceae bacterium]|jgi:fructokinase|nr:carbohydrate kinase [Flavobacteriaceae bacterium]